jgi:hypothetical protein
MNDKLREAIYYGMFKNSLNKKELADLMDFSYPTMLSKINDPINLKLSEADRLCNILDIPLTEFLTIK